MKENYTLYLDDCFNVMQKMADNSVNVVITDPPYNAINRETGGLRIIDKDEADSDWVDVAALVDHLSRICSESVYIWCSTEQAGPVRDNLNKHGFTTRQGVWIKSNPSPMNGQYLWLSAVELCVFGRKPKATFNKHCESPVWWGASGKVPGFPCPKPVWLIKAAIEASASPDAIIFGSVYG